MRPQDQNKSINTDPDGAHIDLEALDVFGELRTLVVFLKVRELLLSSKVEGGDGGEGRERPPPPPPADRSMSIESTVWLKYKF